MIYRDGLLEMSDWGDRIGRLAAAQGLTQQELARVAGVRQPSVNAWLKGNAKGIDGANLVAVARRLQTTAEYIMTGKGESSHAVGIDFEKLSESVELLLAYLKIQGLPVDGISNRKSLEICYQVIMEDQDAGKDSNVVDLLARMRERINAQTADSRTGTNAGVGGRRRAS